MTSSDELKAKGNAAFSSENYEEAIQHFTDAIAIDPNNHVLYSNRSASLASLSRFEEALKDAEKVVEIKPDWPKGHSRVGAALHGLRRWEDAIAAYQKGLDLDPSNQQMKQGLEDAKAAQHARPAGAGGGLFTQPEVLSRLAMDPRTRNLLGQPDFMSMLQDVNSHPENIQKYFGDDRFQLAMEVGLGLAFNDVSSGAQKEENDAPTASPHPASPPSASQQQQQEKEEKEKEEPNQPEPMQTEEERIENDTKEQAYKEKELGNESYKKKEFEAALAHYTKAIELYDRDISFLTNRAAVKFEQADYPGCISDCDQAIDHGRELRADYKLIAKAMTRKANALVKQGDLEGAITTYNRALTEHRNPETLKRLQETEKQLKTQKEEEYIDVSLSAEEKDKGNAAFKDMKYPEAVLHYTESLKRGPPRVNPEAYKVYSNRAACYTKLGAWNEGLHDANECIRLAPQFPKGYSRKGHLQFFMKEYEKAMQTYEKGLECDPDNVELKEGLVRCIQAINKMNRGEFSEEDLKERQEKSMADPEIQSILTDPVMRQVLRDMQEDPASAQKHLMHPEIAKKVEKLVAAGIIQIR